MTHEDYRRQADAIEAVINPITQQLRSALRDISTQFREAIEKTADPEVARALSSVFMRAGGHFDEGLQDLSNVSNDVLELHIKADELLFKACNDQRRNEP